MRFNPVDAKLKGILSNEELSTVNELVDRGNALVDELKKECTFERLKKLINGFIRAVNERIKALEIIIERVFKVNPSMAVRINEIVDNTHELINTLKQAAIVEQNHPKLMRSLSKTLNAYGIKLRDLSVKYWDHRTTITKSKLLLGFTDLSLDKIASLLFSLYKREIEEGFLIDESTRIKASIVKDLIESLNNEELRLAVSEDQKHADFLMQLYILLIEPVKLIKSLKKLVDEHSLSASESVLDASVALINKELTITADHLSKSLSVVKQAREHGVKTQRLISIYNETELFANPSGLIKAYLRVNYELPDLINQLTYDFFANYGDVPERLIKYTEFSNRSKYYFLKQFLID
ncbi:MAG: hypothetical protein WC307_05790 [Candidatus Nanoarchaeia archaeon]|jgi:hypothetical protein